MKPATHIADPPKAPAAPTFVADTGVSAGSAFVPDTTQAANLRTQVDPIPAYQLKAHPERWTVMLGKVVPALGKIKHIRGLNGVDGEAGKKPDVTGAKAGAEAAGWTAIPFSAVPPGSGSSYLWRPEGRPDVHLHFTERVYPGSKRLEADEKRYVEWLQWLIQAGHVPAPAPYVLRQMESEYERRHNDALNRAADYPSYKDVADRAKRDLEAIRAELAKHEETPATGDAFNGDA